MNIKHEPRNYQPVLFTLRISVLENISDNFGVKFLNNIVFRSIYAPLSGVYMNITKNKSCTLYGVTYSM